MSSTACSCRSTHAVDMISKYALAIRIYAIDIGKTPIAHPKRGESIGTVDEMAPAFARDSPLTRNRRRQRFQAPHPRFGAINARSGDHFNIRQFRHAPPGLDLAANQLYELVAHHAIFARQGLKLFQPGGKVRLGEDFRDER
jgi:hypothetical protein